MAQPRVIAAFPKADGPEGSWLERRIDSVTGGLGYGHAELWVEQLDGGWFRATSIAVKETFPSGEYGPGVIYCPYSGNGEIITPYLPGYTKMWLPPDFDWAKAWEILRGEIKSPYDWLGVIRHLVPVVPQSKKAWYCSELVAELLATDPRFAPLKDRKYQYSPNALFMELLYLIPCGEVQWRN